MRPLNSEWALIGLRVIFTHKKRIKEIVDDLIQTDQVVHLLEVLGNETLSAKELIERLGLKHRLGLKLGLIEKTLPNKPRSKNQKYRKKVNKVLNRQSQSINKGNYIRTSQYPVLLVPTRRTIPRFCIFCNSRDKVLFAIPVCTERSSSLIEELSLIASIILSK